MIFHCYVSSPEGNWGELTHNHDLNVASERHHRSSLTTFTAGPSLVGRLWSQQGPLEEESRDPLGIAVDNLVRTISVYIYMNNYMYIIYIVGNNCK